MTKGRRQFPKLNFPGRPGCTFPGQLQKIRVLIFLAGRRADFTVHVPMLIAHMSMCTSSGERSWRNPFGERLSDLLGVPAPFSSGVSEPHCFSVAAVVVQGFQRRTLQKEQLSRLSQNLGTREVPVTRSVKQRSGLSVQEVTTESPLLPLAAVAWAVAKARAPAQPARITQGGSEVLSLGRGSWTPGSGWSFISSSTVEVTRLLSLWHL